MTRRLIGVGVMAYYGGNDDRKQAVEIHARYVEAMTRFTRWLVDNGYRIRLFGGDNKFDTEIAENDPGGPARLPPGPRPVGSHGRNCFHLSGTHPRDGACQHGRGHPLPQRDVRA